MQPSTASSIAVQTVNFRISGHGANVMTLKISSPNTLAILISNVAFDFNIFFKKTPSF
jgi:hypothetical protein